MSSLNGANLRGAHLENVYLVATYLHKADLTRADLRAADLTVGGGGQAARDGLAVRPPSTWAVGSGRSPEPTGRAAADNDEVIMQ